jgi:hypothetical protein
VDEFFQQLHDYMVLTSWAAYFVIGDTVLMCIVAAVLLHKVNENGRKLAWLVNHPNFKPVTGIGDGNVTVTGNPGNTIAHRPNPDRFGWERGDTR